MMGLLWPETTMAGAQKLADKLRGAVSGLRPPWYSTQITLSAGIVEAVAKHDYDSEDIVTDLINRAEFSIEEARKRGGGTVVALEKPKILRMRASILNLLLLPLFRIFCLCSQHLQPNPDEN